MDCWSARQPYHTTPKYIFVKNQIGKKCEQKRDIKHDHGITIGQTDIIRVMLKYPEDITDLIFVTIPTMSPDLHYSDIEINSFSG